MKRNFCTTFYMFLIFLSFGQKNSEKFTEFKTKGDSLYRVKDFRNAAIAFTSATRYAEPGEIIYARWGAASSWSLGNYPDSAFPHLNIIAGSKNLTFSNFIDIILDNDFTSLRNDSRWPAVKNKMFLTAKQTFSTSLQKPGGVIPNYERVDAALAWAIVNNIDSAFYQLQIIAGTKGVFFGMYNNIRTTSILSSLHNDARWEPLIDKLYKNFENTLTTPQDDTYTQEEVIYGRKDGMNLTMIHLKPKEKSNNKAIIQIMSGGWRSSLLNWDYTSSLPYLKKGYSVFVVAHGSAPVYTILDAVSDLQRAVRFQRFSTPPIAPAFSGPSRKTFPGKSRAAAAHSANSCRCENRQWRPVESIAKFHSARHSMSFCSTCAVTAGRTIGSVTPSRDQTPKSWDRRNSLG
jgi:hypothetical protein